MSDPAVPDAPGHDPYAALRFRNYRLFVTGRTLAVVGEQMLAVAVGWEIYQRTSSAAALGIVGLVQVLPVILLALPAGQVADRRDRRRVVIACQSAAVVCTLGLAAASIWPQWPAWLGVPPFLNGAVEAVARGLGETDTDFSDPAITPIYLLLTILWSVRTFNNAARAALLAQIVPAHAFPNAVTWNSSAFQVAAIAGPAAGGFLIWAGGFTAAYGTAAVCMAFYLAAMILVHAPAPMRKREPMSFGSLAAGVRFVFSTRLLLAAITLDLFAVLLGGATALLPMFAERMEIGPAGLGWLQAAPAIGAMSMALLLAHRPPMARAGLALLWAVIGFGAATVGFGLSEWFPLSLLMLFLTGAFDNVSVVVRDTLVQVLTPEEMRGRVSAVNNVFIGSSNQLGAFESGVTAALWGPVASVVGGGIGTILTVLAAAWWWPEIRRFGSLESARPIGEGPAAGSAKPTG